MIVIMLNSLELFVGSYSSDHEAYVVRASNYWLLRYPENVRSAFLSEAVMGYSFSMNGKKKMKVSERRKDNIII